MAVFQISDFSLFHCGGQLFLYAQRSGDGACLLYLFTTLYLFLYTNTESLTALFDVQRFPGQLVRNLLLVQSWSAEGALSYNVVGWFLSTLMFLSVFSLPVMFLLNKINRRPKGWLLLSGALAGTLFLTAVYCYLTKNLDMGYWQYIFPPARMGEYLGGMLLGMLVCTLKPHLKQGYFTFALIFLLNHKTGSAIRRCLPD